MKRIYIDMDGVLCDFKTAFRDAYIPGQLHFPQTQARFFENLAILPGVVAALKELRAISEFDIWILSCPSVKNPHSYTEKRVWVEENLGFYWCEKLILCTNKSLLKGDFLIDDSITEHQEEFEGELIRFGGHRFPDWPAITSYLLYQII